LLAHPIGFLWLVGTTTYIRVKNEIAGLVEVGAAAVSRVRVCRGLLVHVASARCWQIGIAVRFIFIMRGPVGALRENVTPRLPLRHFSGNHLRRSGLLPAQTGGFFLETIRIAVRIVLGDVLRDSAAP